jgi:hypothetical protein
MEAACSSQTTGLYAVTLKNIEHIRVTAMRTASHKIWAFAFQFSILSMKVMKHDVLFSTGCLPEAETAHQFGCRVENTDAESGTREDEHQG